jgi:hypothetical protein
MNDNTAIAIAERIKDAKQKDYFEAWQHLLDTGLVWGMEESFVTLAAEYIDAGFIQEQL